MVLFSHLAKTMLVAFALLSFSMTNGVAEPQGTMRVAHDVGKGARSSLDPIDPGRIIEIAEKTMNRLIRPGSDGRPSADLAYEWETDAAGRTWTIYLRDGVRFHDGSTLDAADVIYSLKRVLDPKRDNPARSVIEAIVSLEAVDEMTIEIGLKWPFVDFPLQLMDSRLRIIPEGSDETIAKTGIGTGPFKVEKFDADGITTLTANTDYWEGVPKLEKIEVIGIPDSNTRLQAFLAGQIDMERGIKPVMRRALQRSPRYVVQAIPTGNWSGLVFLNDVAPFDDPKVRKALRKVVDREEMLKLALDGGGIISCDNPVAPDDQYKAQQECQQDIEGAKALLAEAGYPNGIDVTIHVAPIDGVWSSMAVVYQQQAAKAGIRVKIVNAASDGYWSEIWMKKDSFATSWGARPADQALSEAFASDAKWNESHYYDETFDVLISKARLEVEFERRRQSYISAQKYLAETTGTLIPFHRSQLVALSPRVTGIPAMTGDRIKWHLVGIIDGGS
ncbi:MAG: ABC transporter substrate-binding protein [Pseudomonadota bacterium]